MGPGEPEQGLADGKGGEELGEGGFGWGEGAPDGDVVGVGIGAAGEEQGGTAAGKLMKERGVGEVGPRAAVGDPGGVLGDSNAEAGAVLQLKVPEGLEFGREEFGGAGEEVQGEEGVAVGDFGGELVGKDAVGHDLGAEDDRAEVVAEGDEGGSHRRAIGHRRRRAGARRRRHDLCDLWPGRQCEQC